MIGVGGEPWWATRVRYDRGVILLIHTFSKPPGQFTESRNGTCRDGGSSDGGSSGVGARMVASNALDGRLVGQRAFGGVDIRFGALRYWAST